MMGRWFQVLKARLFRKRAFEHTTLPPLAGKGIITDLEESSMGFTLKVEGPDTIELGLDNIQTVTYETDTPNDSNARSTDVGATLRITGKILTATDGDSADHSMKLAHWSLVPAEKADCYRKATVEVISAGQVVRKIVFPNAFVVDYTERFGDTEGVGSFDLLIKQKKDKTELADIQGGY